MNAEINPEAQIATEGRRSECKWSPELQIFKTVPPTTAVRMGSSIHPSIDDGSNGVVRIALQMEELP
jgi:hypothetical protein